MNGWMDFFADNALYIVLIIATIVWAGVFFFLFGIDRRVRKLEEAERTDAE
ncbi:MAG: CcmD family protein [Ignavibacteriales bacterium]|nr:CcmD family protein [Ignavibacteriales bacterium]